MARLVALTLCCVALLLAVPQAAWAQEGPPQQQAETELVFERELFAYPSFERRNPFRPLVVGEGGRVRFEQLSLMGVLYDDDPAFSVAILGTGELTVSADGAGATRGEGQSWYAKVGQIIGNVRILEIHPTHVVVEVEEFGIMEQKIMELQTRRLGGTQ